MFSTACVASPGAHMQRLLPVHDPTHMAGLRRQQPPRHDTHVPAIPSSVLLQDPAGHGPMRHHGPTSPCEYARDRRPPSLRGRPLGYRGPASKPSGGTNPGVHQPSGRAPARHGSRPPPNSSPLHLPAQGLLRLPQLPPGAAQEAGIVDRLPAGEDGIGGQSKIDADLGLDRRQLAGFDVHNERGEVPTYRVLERSPATARTAAVRTSQPSHHRSPPGPAHHCRAAGTRSRTGPTAGNLATT